MWNSACLSVRSVHLPVSQDSLKSSGTNLQFSAPCSAVPGLQPPPAGCLWMLWHQPTSLILQLQKELKACVCTQWLHHSPNHLVRLDWPNNWWAWLPTSSWRKWLYGRDINLLSEQCTVSGSWPMLCLEQGLICLWITAHRVRDKMNLSSSVRKWVKKVGKGKTVGMFGTRLLSLGSWLGLRWEEAWDQRSQRGEQSGGWALRARRGKERGECMQRKRFVFRQHCYLRRSILKCHCYQRCAAQLSTAIRWTRRGGEKRNTFPGSSAEHLKQSLGLEELSRHRWHTALQWVPVLLGPVSRQGGLSSPALLYLVKLNGISFPACSKKTACNFPSQIIPSSKTKNSLCIWRVQGRGCAEPALSTRKTPELYGQKDRPVLIFPAHHIVLSLQRPVTFGSALSNLQLLIPAIFTEYCKRRAAEAFWPCCRLQSCGVAVTSRGWTCDALSWNQTFLWLKVPSFGLQFCWMIQLQMKKKKSAEFHLISKVNMLGNMLGCF